MDQLYLYLNSSGQQEDRDIHGFGARPQPTSMRPSPDQQWPRRSDVHRDGHRESSFERFRRLNAQWHSRPRSPPPPRTLPYTRSPVRPKSPPTSPSLSRVSYPFDDARHPRSRYANKSQPSSDSYYPGDKSWQIPVAEPRFSKAPSDVLPKNSRPAQSATSQYQPRHLPHKQKTYEHFEEMPRGSESGAGGTKPQGHFTKSTRGRQQGRGKWTGVPHVASNVKKTDAHSASQKDCLLPKVRSELAGSALTGLAVNVGDQLPADTLVSSESAVPIRPEDIIIIRRYNVEGSTTEKKPEESGLHAKRHVVRLVRNNMMMSPISDVGSGMDDSISKDHTTSHAGATQQRVVKRRRWSGIVKTTPLAEDITATNRVDDRTQPDHTRRSVYTF